MISFFLSLADFDGAWSQTDDGWSAGTSWLRPFVHPVLESFAATDGKCTLVTVRERRRNVTGPRDAMVKPVNRHEYQEMRQEALNWPLDFIVLEFSLQQKLHIYAGQWGTAPVFTLHRGNTLRGSWCWSDLLPYLTLRELSPIEVAHYLSHQRYYAKETIFRSVNMLTERSTAIFSDSGLHFEYPHDSYHTFPRKLRSDADAVGCFIRILRATMLQRHLNPCTLAVELSGGVDSALIAMQAVEVFGRGLHSAGILISGRAREQQRDRRQILVERAGFTDRVVDAAAYLPFAGSGQIRQLSRCGPHEEPYREALHAEAAEMTTRGVRTVLTGVGGDELMALRVREHVERRSCAPSAPAYLGVAARRALTDGPRRTRTPSSVLTEPTLGAVASRSPIFLRQGIWPVSLLAQPELIQFCEWLPVEWRRNKRLLRSVLERCGLPAEVCTPVLRENFTDVMVRGMILNGLPLFRKFQRASILVDLGYLQPSIFSEWADACRHGRHLPGMYEALNLELLLSSL